jgi:hypothetical protein
MVADMAFVKLHECWWYIRLTEDISRMLVVKNIGKIVGRHTVGAGLTV